MWRKARAGDAGPERVIPCCPLVASLPDTALHSALLLIDYCRPHAQPRQGVAGPLETRDPSGGPEQIPGPIKLSSAT